MRIELDEKYIIEWDGISFKLIKRKTVTGEGRGAKSTKAENIGKEREEVLGYYGSLGHVIGGYINRDIGESEMSKAMEILEHLTTLEARLTRVFNSIGWDIKKREGDLIAAEESKKAAEKTAAEESKKAAEDAKVLKEASGVPGA